MARTDSILALFEGLTPEEAQEFRSRLLAAARAFRDEIHAPVGRRAGTIGDRRGPRCRRSDNAAVSGRFDDGLENGCESGHPALG
jgi:hypothetical protein